MTNWTIAAPESLLEVVIRDASSDPQLLALHAGYDGGAWRVDDLARELIQWCPDWILSRRELQTMSSANAVELIAKALGRVYASSKPERRGEIGELLLHIALRSFYNSERAISRLYFKDAANDTVKGFDAVHLISNGETLELWLGESKFYKRASRAVEDAVKSIQDHLRRDYLRYEFLAISDKVEDDFPHAAALRELVGAKRAIDDIFNQIVIPIFISYDSHTLSNHASATERFLSAIEIELRNHWEALSSELSSSDIKIKTKFAVILLPMSTKETLVKAFDERLKAWQALTT